MSNHSKTSIIDIAMGILGNMDPNKNIISDLPAPKKIKEEKQIENFVPDVSDTEVTEDYINHLLEGTMNVPSVKKTPKVQVKEVKKTESNKNINEEKLNSLVSRLSALLAEARDFLNQVTEGTTTGSGGVNTGKPNEPKNNKPKNPILKLKLGNKLK